MPYGPQTLPLITGFNAVGGEERCSTAPPGSARGSPSKKGALGRPSSRGGYNESMYSRALTASPPSTVNDSSMLGRTWPQPCGSPREVMQMVHNYWHPVEESVRTRHPQHLEVALRRMHGTQYLRTIHTVRRSTGLKAAERHAIEMELAARLVRARAVLGKWKAGKREIQEAQKARDPDRLDKTLEKWSFAEDDTEVAEAKAELERWRNLAVTLPDILREAVEKRDVEQIRRAVTELNASGPAGVEGEVGARKFLSKYDTQVRTLRDAMASLSSEAVEVALQSWTFDRADLHVKEANEMLQRREEQQHFLRAAVTSRDGPELQKAVEGWQFEKDEEIFLQAKGALQRYMNVSRAVNMLSEGKGKNLPQLADVLNSWEFTNHDPVLYSARGQIEAYEDSVRTALRNSDAWVLERLGTTGRAGRALPASLQEEVSNFLCRYRHDVAELQSCLQSAEDFSVTMEPLISQHASSWSFAEDDPNLGCALLWLRFHKSGQVQTLHALRRANTAGDVFSLRRMLDNWRGIRSDTCVEMKAARETCGAFTEAIEVIGAVALGVEPDQLHGALERSHELEKAMQSIKLTVDSIQVQSITELKRLAKPPRIVHAVLETLLHVLAGVSPHIRDPPRDVEWRSCQKMVSNAAVLRANLLEVPNWVASGNLAGIMRARAVSQKFQADFGDQWSLFGTRIKNVIAGQLFQYLEHLFLFAELIEASEGNRTTRVQPEPPAADGPADDGKRLSQGSVKRNSSTVRKSLTAPSMGDILEMYSLTCECKHLRPLQVLQRTRHCLCRSMVLAIAWVLSGNDPQELQLCLQRMRKYLCAAEAAATVARQLLANLAPALEVASRDQASASDAADVDAAGAAVTELGLTVQLISGNIVAAVRLDGNSTVAELKERLRSTEGTPVKQQRLLSGTATLRDGLSLRRQGVTDGALLTLIRLSPTLPEQLQAAAEEVATWGTDGLNSTGRPDSAAVSPSEPAAQLLYGTGSEHLSASSRKRPMHSDMIRVLRSASAVVSAMQSVRSLRELCPGDMQSWSVQAFSEPTTLDLEAVQSLCIPLANLAAAKRALLAGECPLAVEKFVDIMHVFYNEFVPLRAAWAQSLVCVEEARSSLRHAEEVVAFAAGFDRMDKPPQCIDKEGVVQATVRALDQVQTLAQHGLALPAVHVEYVRMAIDSAGAHLLANPPCADPGTRIRWSEAAMAIQLAPLPHFGAALSTIARGVDFTELEVLGRQFGEPEPECVRLLGAVIWVIQQDCRCNPTWQDVKRSLANAEEFVHMLAEWSPIRDTSVARIGHARGLLLGIWGWIAAGCGGNKALGTIFAWVSLVVALLPLSEMAQRLTPVYKAVKQGIAKSERAAPEQQFLAKAKAWTAALFLLDGPGEHWWWLHLIRPSADMDMPWTDGEDGGVGEAHAHEIPVEEDDAGRWDNWDPSGLNLKAGSNAPGLELASPADESLQGSVDFEHDEEQVDEQDLDTDLLMQTSDPDEEEYFLRQETDLPGAVEDGGAAATPPRDSPEAEQAERPSSPRQSPPEAEAPTTSVARASPSPDTAEQAATEPQAAETAAVETPTG